jgi:bifunctional DNA primase/polymerase-like protein/primase-like protein
VVSPPPIDVPPPVAITRSRHLTVLRHDAGKVSSRVLEEALTYSAIAPVFPVHHPLHDGSCSCERPTCPDVGKHPATRHGVADATSDASKIRAWWTTDPNFSIAIATGDGLTVLDIDEAKGGFDSLSRLPPMPDTPTVQTGGGGLHYYFSGNTRTRVGVAPGIDIRANGSYVVAPPSVHRSGQRYIWAPLANLNVIPLAPLPIEVVALAEAKNPQPKPEGPIPHGRRNDTLARLAGGMRGMGMGLQAINAALAAENVRCDPPLTAAELGRIAKSMATYEANPVSKVRERLGVLAGLPWIPLPLVSITDRRFGVTPAESKAMQWVLAEHRGDFVWGSFSQGFRAAQMGLDASSLSESLGSLRHKGFVGTRSDKLMRRLKKRAPLAYCGEPYLVIETLWAGHDEPTVRAAFQQAAAERMARYVAEVERGRWFWRIGELIADQDSCREVASRFIAAYGPPVLREERSVVAK